MSIFGYYYNITPTSDIEFTEIVPDTVSFENLELNRDNFYFVCYYFGIEHPEIVYAQAELESARFTSKVFKENNNFLGLYNSKKKTYYNFDHWTDCLKGYKNYVQLKWDGKENYYTFLEQLPYASDPDYIRKVKILVKNYNIKQ